MTDQRKMKIGVFFSGSGGNMASWRHPSSVPDGAVNLNYYRGMTRTAEDAKLDFAFFGDGLYISEKSHPNFLVRFEPLTLLAALSMDTTHIGLAATLSTTYSDPYTVARQFSSIDHLSDGRAGWNIVTSPLEGSASNYSKPEHPQHDLRYRMADEFVEVAKGLLPRSLDQRVFPLTKESLRRTWSTACRKSGVENLRFHDLRHEAISRFFEMGLSIPEVALISGHKDYRMLARYTHLRAEDLVGKLG